MDDDDVAARCEQWAHIPPTETAWFMPRLPPWVDRAELESAAWGGLWAAAQAWDPSRGVPFKAYAKQRVKWALLDAARRSDDMTRRDRRSLAVDPDAALPAWAARPLSWDAGGFDHPATVDTAADALLHEETLAEVEAAIRLLPEQHRSVIRTYAAGGAWGPVARRLGVTEARVSQLCGDACGMLRGALTGDWPVTKKTGRLPVQAARYREAWEAHQQRRQEKHA